MKNFGFGAFILISLFGVLGSLNHYNYLSKEWPVTGSEVFVINKGESPRRVVERLKSRVNFGSAQRFFRYGQFYGYTKQIRYGRVQLPQRGTLTSLYEALAQAQAEQIQIQHIEGKNLYDFARTLEKQGVASYDEALSFLKNPKNVQRLLGDSFNKIKIKSFEGYLYPDTYSFNKGVTVEAVVKTLTQRFQEVFSNLPNHNLKLNNHQIVTLASIIEKETGAGFERPMISSVFHNRMKKGMRLETDPTVMYGILHKTQREITNIRKKHLKDQNPYNTYLIPGLPPGPIASPGKEALRAAISPETSDYLFFVSKNNGTHVFTTKYSDHLKAVKDFQLNPAARKGKSWRDLKKVNQ